MKKLKSIFTLMILLLFCSSAASALGEENPDQAYLAELNVNGNTLLLTDHSDDISEGNWIKLSGGDSIILPDPFDISYTGVDRTGYHSENLNLDLELEPNLEKDGRYSKKIGYPYSTHPIYTKAGGKNSVTMDFKGSSEFAGKNVNVYLVEASLGEVRDTFSELRKGNIADYSELFHTCFDKEDYDEYLDRALDGNGDLNLVLGPRDPGHYAVLVLLDDGEDTTLLSATAFEVVPYEMTLTLLEDPSNIQPNTIPYVEVDIGGPEGDYTYVGVLINKANYGMEIELESNGSRTGTNITVNGNKLASGIELPSEMNSLTDALGIIGVDTQNKEDLINFTSDLFGKNTIYLKKSGTNNIEFPLDLENFAEGDYVLLVGAMKSGSGIASIAQTEFSVGGATSEILNIVKYSPEDLNPGSRVEQPQEFSVETNRLCTINWFVDGQLVRSTPDSMEDCYTNSTAKPGKHIVSAVVSDGENTDQLFWTWTVTVKPINTRFTADVLSGSAPLTVQFTDNSTGDPMPDSWSWDFGDGSSSSEQNPKHEYMAAGTYNVTLTTGNAYDSDKFERRHYISVIPTYIRAPSEKLLEGETEDFSVEVAQLNSIDTVNFKLKFNNTLLDVESVTFSEDFEGTPVWDTNTKGVLNVSASPNSPISVDKYTELVDIKFNASGNVPFPSFSVPLTFTEAKVVDGPDKAEADIDQITNGALELFPAATIRAGDAKLEVGENATFTVSVEGLQAENVKFFMNFNESLVSVESITANTSEFEDLDIVSRTINNKKGWFRVFVKSQTGINAENTAPILDIKLKSKGVPGNGDLKFGVGASWKKGPNFRFDSTIPGEVNVTAKTIVATETGEVTIKNATFNDTEQKVSIDTHSENVSVSKDKKTIEIRNPGLTISLVSPDASGFEQNASAGEGVMEGNFSAQIEKPPVEATVGGDIGTVLPSFNASAGGALSNLTKKGAALNITVTPGIPEKKAGHLFSIAGLNIEEVAYTMSIEKENLSGVDFKDATIVMPVPQAYVNARGGPEDFKILSINDTGFVSSLSTNYTRDDDSDPRLYIFTGDSPDGFSDKVLAKATEVTKPEADFSYTPEIIGVGDTVNFIDNSSNAPTAWEWDFGDGNKSNWQYPVHSFAVPGTYPVTLNASNTEGWNETTKYITVGTEPEANFTASPKAGDASLTVKFTDLSENATAWEWDFGDETKETVSDADKKNVSHTYRKAGTYTVSLTVTNAYGSDTIEKPSYIHVTASSTSPVANFTATPLSGKTPLNVHFTDLSDNEPTAWEWNFGDGDSSTEQNPVHTYAAAGTYSVSLNASNGYGSDIKTRTDYITVSSGDDDTSSGHGGSHGGSHSGGIGIGSGESSDNVQIRELYRKYVGNGAHVIYAFADDRNPITNVEFESNRNFGCQTASVEVLKGKSKLVSGLPAGEVYSCMNILVGNIKSSTSENMANGLIKFRVKKSWISENEIKDSTVALQSYSEGQWNVLQTRKTGEDEEYAYFEASTEGFTDISYAITGGTKSVEIVPTPGDASDSPKTDKEPIKSDTGDDQKDPGSIPGFTSLVGFVAVLLTGLVLLRRNE